MINMKTLFTFFLFLGWIHNSPPALGQNRYAVHFKFKPQEQFSFDHPTGFLSEKAIVRKARHNIELDSLDLPISSKYLMGIVPFIERNIYNSHWLNAAIVVMDAAHAPLISNLPYVEKVVLAAPGVGTEFDIQNRLAAKNNKWENYQLSQSDSAHLNFQNVLIGIDKMRNDGYTGEGILIAVFDTGFPNVDLIPAFRQLFENNTLIATRNFVNIHSESVFTSHSHGTNVLSLIAANDPEALIAGAPNASFILCLTEDVLTEYRIEEYNWVKAAEFADSLGVDIINSSLGYMTFDDPDMNYTHADFDGKTAVISRGASIAADKGILVVNSIGNSGRAGEGSLSAPSDAINILSIGALDAEQNRAGFSSQGPTADGRIKPELSTYGESVYLLNANGAVVRGSGTSFAAPQITALAAGLWGAKPDWSRDKLISRLIQSATQTDKPDNLTGYGIPKYSLAYGEIISGVPQNGNMVWSIYPNPLIDNKLFVKFGNEYEAEFTLYNLSGKVLFKRKIERISPTIPFELDLSGLGSGIYVIEMRNSESVQRGRLIKR